MSKYSSYYLLNPILGYLKDRCFNDFSWDIKEARDFNTKELAEYMIRKLPKNLNVKIRKITFEDFD